MGCAESREKKPQGSRLQVKTSVKAVAVKIVLLGDAGVGKSSICQRYINNKISDKHEITIGGAYLEKEVTLDNGQKLLLHIWDTSGEERFRAMASLHYRDTQAALLVYDVTDVRTFQSLDYWVRELDEKVRDENMIVVMTGNKSDLPDRRVATEQAKTFANSNSLQAFDVSAKTGANIDELFRNLANQLSRRLNENGHGSRS